MGIGRETFYDTARIAIMPMGFCYPGRLKNGGDAPPRPECAPLWHERFLRLMPAIELVPLVGGYAQLRYLGRGSMTAHVQAGQGGGSWPCPSLLAHHRVGGEKSLVRARKFCRASGPRWRG